MPDQFRCVPNDPFLIANYPTIANLIAQHQTAENYIFELHGGHETGNPIYIRIKDGDEVDSSTSNVTKFDTKNKTKVEIVNSGRLTNKKQNTLGTRLTDTEYGNLGIFCAANFAFFKRLGEEYYVKSPAQNTTKTVGKSKVKVPKGK